MPRLKRSVRKYRLHKPSGRAVVTLHGTDHYLAPESIAKYDKLVASYLAAGRRTAEPENEPDEIILLEVLAAYWKHAECELLQSPPVHVPFDLASTLPVRSCRYTESRPHARYLALAPFDGMPEIPLSAIRNQDLGGGGGDVANARADCCGVCGLSAWLECS